MTRRVLAYVWLLTLCASALYAQGRYTGRSLGDVLRELQSGGLNIVFSSELVRADARVLAEPRSRTPRRILEEVLKPHGLEVRSGAGNTLLVVRSSRNRSGRPPAVLPQAGSIAGRVIDAETGAPIDNVTVQVQDSGHSAQTDGEGHFAMSDVPAGVHALFVSTIGYSLARPSVEVKAGATVTIEVPLAEGTGAYTERVTVTADELATPDRSTPALQTLSSAGLQNVRAVLVDDPFRAVQAMPGVAANDDFRSDFSVRGADFGHIGLSIDGVATPFLLHDFQQLEDAGSMSIINSDILDRVTLSFGTHPQRAGDKTGAWLDFSMREGSRAATEVRGSVSGTNASLLAEGPIGSDARGSWLVSTRRSYIDWLVRRVVPEFDAVFGFTDVEGKVVYDMTPRHQLQVTTITGRARLNQTNDDHPNVVKHAADDLGFAAMALRSTVGRSTIVTQRLSAVDLRFRNLNPYQTEIGRGRFGDFSYRADLAWTPKPAVVVEAGAQRQQQHETLTLHNFAVTSTGLRLNNLDTFDESAHVTSGFVHASLGAGRRWTIEPGARVSRSSLAEHAVASPWVQARWSLAPSLSVRAGTGVYHQFPDFAQAFGPHAGVGLRAERARHADLALEHTIGAHTGWQIALYDRRDEDLLRVQDEPRLVNGSVIFPEPYEPHRNALEGGSRGVEVSVQRQRAQGLSGWLSYAWGHTKYRDVFSGETFDGDVDQRHAVNIWTQYALSSRTSISGKLRFGTNFPRTGYWDQQKAGLFLADEPRNDVRLPAYARLDLRANRVFNYTRRRLTLFVEVMNVLNRANVRTVGPSLAGGPSLTVGPRSPQAFDYEQELFPRLPSAGLLIEF